MSSAEFQLDLSPQAQRDLIDILRYTGKKWGLDQLLAYRDKLNEALRLLKQNPEIGQESDYLPATHRLYLVGSHVIVYRRHGTMIGVVRILHQRMNWIKHLPALCARKARIITIEKQPSRYKTPKSHSIIGCHGPITRCTIRNPISRALSEGSGGEHRGCARGCHGLRQGEPIGGHLARL